MKKREKASQRRYKAVSNVYFIALMCWYCVMWKCVSVWGVCVCVCMHAVVYEKMKCTD